MDHLQVEVFLNAVGISDLEQADQQYIQRFLTLVNGFLSSARFCLLAINKAFHPDGRVNEEYTKFFIPNEYLMQACASYPTRFVPCISLHPYRRNALP